MSSITSARSITESNVAYKDEVLAIMDGGVVTDHRRYIELAEEHRRVMSDLTHGDSHHRNGPVVRRKPLVEQVARVNDDGSITCEGPCGETKPSKKFPTLKGGAGRGRVCRSCRDAAKVGVEQ